MTATLKRNQRLNICGDVEMERRATLGLVRALASRYEIAPLGPLLDSTEAALESPDLSIAVVGRFKAGKSSFLNSLFGRDLLPVGVVPVTSVITHVVYGPAERCVVHFLDGAIREIPVRSLRTCVAESENPENQKNVARVIVELPSLAPLRGIRFVDTPGLESVLTHNTDAALEWLPNVGMALVAISVDPPLSHRDVELIRGLYQYTPHVAILLTKIDTMTASEVDEVQCFIGEQLRKQLGETPPIYPSSTLTEYRDLRERFEREVLRPAISSFDEKRVSIVETKLRSAVQECDAFLSVALRAAEALDTDQELLRSFIADEKRHLEEFTIQLRLITKHVVAGTRATVESALQKHQSEIENKLASSLRDEFPGWAQSIASALSGFEQWLESAVSSEMSRVSGLHAAQFSSIGRKLADQLRRLLQEYRDRLSTRVEAVFGVPLHTTEMENRVQPPRKPDVRVGKVFDHNWEAFSWFVPMRLVSKVVLRHFLRAIPRVTFANLSRLTGQWEEIINRDLLARGNMAVESVKQLIGTVESLLAAAKKEAPSIQADLDRLRSVREQLRLPAAAID